MITCRRMAVFLEAPGSKPLTLGMVTLSDRRCQKSKPVSSTSPITDRRLRIQGVSQRSAEAPMTRLAPSQGKLGHGFCGLEAAPLDEKEKRTLKGIGSDS